MQGVYIFTVMLETERPCLLVRRLGGTLSSKYYSSSSAQTLSLSHTTSIPYGLPSLLTLSTPMELTAGHCRGAASRPVPRGRACRLHGPPLPPRSGAHPSGGQQSSGFTWRSSHSWEWAELASSAAGRRPLLPAASPTPADG